MFIVRHFDRAVSILAWTCSTVEEQVAGKHSSGLAAVADDSDDLSLAAATLSSTSSVSWTTILKVNGF